MLSRYLEGEIGPEQCAEMDRHVMTCARCRAQCDSLRRVLALCKNEGRTASFSPTCKRRYKRRFEVSGFVRG